MLDGSLSTDSEIPGGQGAAFQVGSSAGDTVNLAIGDVSSEALLGGLRGVAAVSSGAACASATLEPSHVLRAIGVSDALAHCSLRFGLGRATTADDIDRVASAVAALVAEALRSNDAASIAPRTAKLRAGFNKLHYIRT